MKNPRAANFVWKCSNGRFLYWFHNHGGEFIRQLGGHSSMPNGLSVNHFRTPYDDRNPVWMSAGREIEGPNGKLIEWSQPEILLYDDDPYIRISYPDLIEKDGRLWFTETQKSTARVHAVDPTLIDDLFSQFEQAPTKEPHGLLLKKSGTRAAEVWSLAMPTLPLLTSRDFVRDDQCGKDLRAGCTLNFVLNGIPAEGAILFDSRNAEKAGILVRVIESAKIEVTLSDSRTISTWTSDAGSLEQGALNNVGVIIDGGPKLILFVINGALCDGGDERQFGWGRYNPALREINGATEASVHASVQEVALYDRALRVSELIGKSFF
jgi:hypothetical protein